MIGLGNGWVAWWTQFIRWTVINHFLTDFLGLGGLISFRSKSNQRQDGERHHKPDELQVVLAKVSVRALGEEELVPVGKINGTF